MDLSALRLYLITSSYINHANVDDEQTWCDLGHMLPYLKQMLSCLVCGNLLCRPCKSSESACLHYVCRQCIGGRMNIKPSCSWCKDYSMFVENRQVRLLVLNFKKLCEFVQASKIYSFLKTQQLDDLRTSVSHLSDIIDEGACFADTTSEDEESGEEEAAVTVKSLLAAHCKTARSKRPLNSHNTSSPHHSPPYTASSSKSHVDTLTTPDTQSQPLPPRHKLQSKRVTTLNYFERAKNLWNEMNKSSGGAAIGNNSQLLSSPLHVSISASGGDTAASPSGPADMFTGKMKPGFTSFNRKKQQRRCFNLTNVSAAPSSVPSSKSPPVQYSVISSNIAAGTNSSLDTNQNSKDNIKIMLKKTLKKASANSGISNGGHLINSLVAKSSGKGGKKSGGKKEKQLVGGAGGSGNVRRVCRCGTATASPGKLTCCGQRCPCYIDKRACLDCKCRGCRNTFGVNAVSTLAGGRSGGGATSGSATSSAAVAAAYYSNLLSSVCANLPPVAVPSGGTALGTGGGTTGGHGTGAAMQGSGAVGTNTAGEEPRRIGSATALELITC